MDNLQQKDNVEDNTSVNLEDELIRNFVETQKARLALYKTFTEFAFFAGCQILSAALAINLFNYAVSLWFTCLLCLIISWLPLIGNLANISIKVSSEGWEFVIMSDYIQALFKFVIGVGVTSVTIYKLSSELTETNKAIQETYTELNRLQNPNIVNFLPPLTGQILLLSVSIVAIGYFIDKLKK